MMITNDTMSFADPKKDEQHDIIRSTRVEPPAHYTFQINSFSVLSEIGMKKCESGDFEVDGYNWKLNLYPNGDEKVEDHISLYLALSAKDNLSLGWEVKVIFRFFIFDQIRGNYLTIQDGKMKKYSKMKSEYGITHLLSHKAWNEASNGYLVDDCCTFGVEVSVLKASNKGESLTITKEPQLEPFLWYIYPFSSHTSESYTSPQFFSVKGRKWRMMMYPNGFSLGKGTHLSLFLKLDGNENIPVGKKIYVKYFLGAFNFGTKSYFEKLNERWFTSSSVGYGFSEFLPLKDLKDSSKSYLQGEGLFLRARIVALSTVEDF